MAPVPWGTMKTTLLLAVSAVAAAHLLCGCGAEPAPAPATGQAPASGPRLGPDVGDRIPAYRATVSRPGTPAATAASFDTHAATKPTLYIMNSTSCPYCTAYIGRMKDIEKTYMAKGIDVVHVYPVRDQTPADKAAYHAKNGFAGGLLVDADASFAKSLKINKTPTVVLTDAKGTITYRGRIDDNTKAQKVDARELALAIDAVLGGKPASVTKTEPFG